MRHYSPKWKLVFLPLTVCDNKLCHIWYQWESLVLLKHLLYTLPLSNIHKDPDILALKEKKQTSTKIDEHLLVNFLIILYQTTFYNRGKISIFLFQTIYSASYISGLDVNS